MMMLLLLGTLYLNLAWKDYGVHAFLIPPASVSTPKAFQPTLSKYVAARSSRLNVEESEGQRTNDRRGLKKPRRKITIADLKKELLKDPSMLIAKSAPSRKSRRTRQRVENPKQTYLYAAQRKMLVEPHGKVENEGGQGENENGTENSAKTGRNNTAVLEARQMGLTNAFNQHCDPLVDTVEPQLLGQIRVGEEETGSGAYAYFIYKPVGWSIMGTSNNQREKSVESTKSSSSDESGTVGSKKSTIKRVTIKDGRGGDEYLEFDEADVLALLSPEERTLIDAQAGSIFEPSGPAYDDEIPGWYDVAKMTREEREEAGIEAEDYDPNDVLDFDESDVLALLSPVEREEYEVDKQQQNIQKRKDTPTRTLERYFSMDEKDLDSTVLENVKRIIGRNSSTRKHTATFSSVQRPSIVSWLKDAKAEEGKPIRGGNFWTALAGATDVDDSGVVLLCPKANTKNLALEYAEYIAVVGNGNYIAPKMKKGGMKEIPTESIQLDIVSRVKKGREGDVCQTVRFVIPEHVSTCSSIINPAQSQFEDGIRGDPAANPFDRRAPRRLIHCSSMAVSSLIFDENVEVEAQLPDDIAILSDRLNNHKFQKGSFLGRQSLRVNPLTNAYREINGVADGFPGWTVDRYGKWLFVQHDEKEYRGPLPSIHDGSTDGVYLLPANPDRGAMGSKDNIRPMLLEGRPAPEIIPILENGITYHVSLDRDLSTGIFLDQRPQRAWLSRYCNEDTHVLNCFSHCGAFSVAAATAGASTVSLDLNKKWLDRIEPQLKANGIAFDERHDCIYGDCFDWLEKLSTRGEKFDIVILDPPSSSMGKKKRRWSVKNDMDELVKLASPLVKEGGLLWTTTNCGSISPLKFANLCRKGFNDVGVSARLERIQPMPVDFPSVGAQQVKNLVWRIG